MKNKKAYLACLLVLVISQALFWGGFFFTKEDPAGLPFTLLLVLCILFMLNKHDVKKHQDFWVPYSVSITIERTVIFIFGFAIYIAMFAEKKVPFQAYQMFAFLVASLIMALFIFLEVNLQKLWMRDPILALKIPARKLVIVQIFSVCMILFQGYLAHSFWDVWAFPFVK
jgi:hypothetical protein